MIEKSLRRFLVFGMLGLFMISMMAGVIGANGDGATTNGEDLAEGVKIIWEEGAAFFGAFFGDTIIGNEMLSRIFMAILLGMFIYTAFGSIFKESGPGVHWIATIATTLIAMIGLPDAFLESIRISYGAMGGTILSVIPFLIIFWFTVKVESIMVARITWLFFMLYYFTLYSSKVLAELGKVGFVSFISGSALPYGVAMLGGFIAFFMILRVRGFIFKGEMEEVVEKGTQKIVERKHRLAMEMERLKADE